MWTHDKKTNASTTTTGFATSAATMIPSSPSTSTTITHRTNKVSSLVHNRRPQSMLSSARALMFDEPAAMSYDRDLLKLSTSPKQQQHHHQVKLILLAFRFHRWWINMIWNDMIWIIIIYFLLCRRCCSH